MEGFAHIFEGVADPRRSNATLRDPDGMPMIGLPSAPRGGGAAPTWSALAVPRGGSFMRLAHGNSGPRHLAQPVQHAGPRWPAAGDAAACRGLGGRIGRWGGGRRWQGIAPVVRRCDVAVPAASGAGVRRRGASGVGTGADAGQVERDCSSAGAVGDAGAEGAGRDGGRDAHTVSDSADGHCGGRLPRAGTERQQGGAVRAGQSHLNTGVPFAGQFPAKSGKIKRSFGVFAVMFEPCPALNAPRFPQNFQVRLPWPYEDVKPYPETRRRTGTARAIGMLTAAADASGPAP